MSRHDFRLRSVLRVRKRELDIARGRLADELREKDQEEREQQRYLMQFHDTSRSLHERLVSGISGATLGAVDAALGAAHMGAIAAGDRVAEREATITEALSSITDARKRVRGLEILEARWRARRRRERAKQEQKRLDEIAMRPRGESSS